MNDNKFKKMSRQIIDVLTSWNGNPINIYKVENNNVNDRLLREGNILAVTYRLGERGEATIVSEYLGATDGNRSLRFQHPTKGEGYSLYVPYNNISSMEICN